MKNLRKQIDILDKELIRTLSERMSIVKKIGEYKKEHNLEPLDEKRWSEVLESRKKWARKMELDEEFIEEIFNTIHTKSIDIEK